MYHFGILATILSVAFLISGCGYKADPTYYPNKKNQNY